jgi:hypothetical protein
MSTASSIMPPGRKNASRKGRGLLNETVCPYESQTDRHPMGVLVTGRPDCPEESHIGLTMPAPAFPMGARTVMKQPDLEKHG